MPGVDPIATPTIESLATSRSSAASPPNARMTGATASSASSAASSGTVKAIC